MNLFFYFIFKHPTVVPSSRRTCRCMTERLALVSLQKVDYRRQLNKDPIVFSQQLGSAWYEGDTPHLELSFLCMVGN